MCICVFVDSTINVINQRIIIHVKLRLQHKRENNSRCVRTYVDTYVDTYVRK